MNFKELRKQVSQSYLDGQAGHDERMINSVSENVEAAFKEARESFRSVPCYVTKVDQKDQVEFLNRVGKGIVIVECLARPTKDYIIKIWPNMNSDASYETPASSQYGERLRKLMNELLSGLVDKFYTPVVNGLKEGQNIFVFDYPPPETILELLNTEVIKPEVSTAGKQYKIKMVPVEPSA